MFIEVVSMHAVSRPPSDNVFQVAFKIPEEWIARADKVAELMSRPGARMTRTDALRAALIHGLEALDHELSPPAKPRKR
jgi:hypothetical protein